MLILSYENEFNLHVKEISFSYERMSTKTRFEEEAKGNSEMAYSKDLFSYVGKIPDDRGYLRFRVFLSRKI